MIDIRWVIDMGWSCVELRGAAGWSCRPNRVSVHFATARKSENAHYTRSGSLSEAAENRHATDGLMD
jgi:hypothetical protein